MKVTGIVGALILSLPLAASQGHSSPSPSIAESAIPALVQEVIRYQIEDFHHTAWGLRYRVHRVDSKEDSLRDLIESADGNVARTLQRHGQPLSAEQDRAEQARLRSLTLADIIRRRHNSDSSDKYGLELLRAMPRAMVYTLVAGQPQLPNYPANQIVLDFTPNPDFHPATTTQSVLPGLSGRIWIDGETHHLTRIEVHITRNLNVMMGLLIRVYGGGSLIFEQHPTGGGHDAYSHIEINVRLRELMVKTVPYHSVFDATDVTYLPTPPSFQEAVNLLLGNTAPSRP